ncbi:PPC domain-containing protein [Cystobacter ferrugineus]|uniref:PPC domain-containing protein n=1 Tax=Cystobacter ferrugineus TaxID=83449 RepID=UPI000A078EC4|nr:PPC domain-containing protein [Cystobacter ferrugineus]
MHHRILPALLALSLVACGVEGSNTELTESTHAQGVQADAVKTACSTPLSNGVTVTGISAELDAWSCTYTLEVPEGTGRLSFDMNQLPDAKGAAYMYVRFGSEPTFDTYDCRPGNLVGVNCTFLRPRAGTWYVKISGAFGPSASGLELTGTYTLGIPSDSVLTNGVETAPYLYKGSQWKCFTLDVPSGTSSVVFTERLTKTGWNIPPDLYVRYGEQPTKTAYDCSTYTNNGLATCTIDNPAAGTWFACSYGDYPREGVVIKGTYP